jgi:DMSO/TMAO reductase YedYZ heme-binding membrane subunit
MSDLALGGGPSPLWFATRATGSVAMIFLTAVVALGVMCSVRYVGERIPRFVITGLHRNLTLVSLGFLVLHIATAVLDTFAGLGWLDAVVPFTAAYRPIWVGLGALAFDILLVVTVTSLVRARLGYRRWKALHWSAYACWVLMLVHALGTGSDARVSLFLAIAGICGAATAVAIVIRLAAPSASPGEEPDARERSVKVAAGLLAVVVAAVVGTWAVLGPLEPGWASRAGTPSSLIGGHS